MELTETDTVVEDLEVEDEDEAEQNATREYTHYRLDEPIDVEAGRSIDSPILIQDVEHIVAYQYEGEVTNREKAQLLLQDDMEPEDIPETFMGAQIFHSDENGNLGAAFVEQRESTAADALSDFLDSLDT